MLNSFNREIEERALVSGYINAIIEMKEDKQLDDFEAVVEQLHPYVLEKVKNEFYVKKYFPNKKIDDSILKFFT